jgi:pre-mRNA-splicing factor 38A
MKSTAAQNISQVELILRNRVFNCYYWKDKCFGLTSETIIDKVLEIKYIGGMNHSSNQPTDFICLFIKMLQLNPSEEIVDEYLSDPDLKYLRALTALFIRFAYPPVKIYTKLEKLFCDYKKLVILKSKGYAIIHMDEYIDSLLNDENIFEISLPKIPKRSVLEENGSLKPYVSVLENELNIDRNKKDDESEDESETESEKDIDIFQNLKIPDNFFKNKKRKRSEDKKDEEKRDKDKDKNKKDKDKEKDKNNNDKKITEKKYIITDDKIKIDKNVGIKNIEDKKDKKDKSKDDKNISQNKEKDKNDGGTIKLPDLDPESDEYWLELRKRLGIS